MAKKRNAADATIRNVRAGKRRDAALVKRVAQLESRVFRRMGRAAAD